MKGILEGEDIFQFLILMVINKLIKSNEASLFFYEMYG